ncbi:MAG: hypothetical protein FRX49_08155 [Trebouxia sp. A1-2]|nr:MAG: hypothetical protein FRX49_08155 [Trebouxia sp. A1-2]
MLGIQAACGAHGAPPSAFAEAATLALVGRAADCAQSAPLALGVAFWGFLSWCEVPVRWGRGLGQQRGA